MKLNSSKIVMAGLFMTFTLSACTGFDRREERRDDRQDCRVEEGAVGGDKRDCKQEARVS